MANNFSNDSACKALWNLESGALTTDSKGTNTLTNNNTVGTNTSDYKQGAGCADFELDNAEALSISDASLDSDFPLKSGDTNKVISVCAWFKLESIDANGRTIFSKYDYGSGERTFHISVRSYSTGYAIQSQIAYNSGLNSNVLQHTSLLSTGNWYHVTFTYQNSDKTWAIRLRDTSGNVVGTDATGTATLDANKLYVSTGPFAIGCMFTNGAIDDWQAFDGLIDEVVVFNDVLTADESTAIAKGLYPVISGSVCWGHSTGVTEDNVRTITLRWAGTGTISGSGDSEKILLASGQYMESEPVQISGNVRARLNVYVQ